MGISCVFLLDIMGFHQQSIPVGEIPPRNDKEDHFLDFLRKMEIRGFDGKEWM